MLPRSVAEHCRRFAKAGNCNAERPFTDRAAFRSRLPLSRRSTVRSVLKRTKQDDPQDLPSSGKPTIAAVLLFVVNLVRSYFNGAAAGNDPWDAWTLEWSTSSPPPVRIEIRGSRRLHRLFGERQERRLEMQFAESVKSVDGTGGLSLYGRFVDARIGRSTGS